MRLDWYGKEFEARIRVERGTVGRNRGEEDEGK
jgi:hypothetical protein